MLTWSRRISLAVAFFIFLLDPVVLHSAQDEKVLVIRISGVINPVSAEFISKSISMAENMRAEALVIELDTPGGLDASMRIIVKDILGSRVPVVTNVSPSGARAASAGVFIAMASSVAAMAPGTNIGAAHPVSLSGKMDKTMSEKAANDAAAYIRSLARRNGRNADWAESSVRKSISATESEALKQNVINLVSADLSGLMKEIDQRKVTTPAGEKVLRTAGAAIVTKEMDLRYRILYFLSDPSVAYVLMLLGFYGLFFELSNPGSILPGVAGAIFLVLAFYSFQTLPVNYAGLLLIVLALVFFVLEIKIISHGVLAIGGIISMIIGSLMLFESPAPFLRLSIYLILPAVLITALFFTLTVRLAYKAFLRTPLTGREGLIGMEGRAIDDFSARQGQVAVHGEIWEAIAEDEIRKNDIVIVETVSGLKIKVRKKEEQ